MEDYIYFIEDSEGNTKQIKPENFFVEMKNPRWKVYRFRKDETFGVIP